MCWLGQRCVGGSQRVLVWFEVGALGVGQVEDARSEIQRFDLLALVGLPCHDGVVVGHLVDGDLVVFSMV